jgi:hypothetical protein
VSKPAIRYHYRGLIERGRNYDWKEGYSEGEGQTITYPWMTRRECQSDARKRGARAVFVREDVQKCSWQTETGMARPAKECGKPITDGPYCAEHAQDWRDLYPHLAHQVPTPSKRE